LILESFGEVLNTGRHANWSARKLEWKSADQPVERPIVSDELANVVAKDRVKLGLGDLPGARSNRL